MHLPSLSRPAVAVLGLAAAALFLSACQSAPLASKTGSSSAGAPVSGTSGSSGSSTSKSSAPSSTKPTVAAAPVHVQGYPDGSEVGVGMPIIATFNKKVTDGRGFAKGITVTVNGSVVKGAWYFEPSDPQSGHVMEAHYRLHDYWPAHARIHVALNLKGVSAGKGLAFDGKLTSLDFTTGARNITVVDDATKQMTVTSDGKTIGTYPVSLGTTRTPTKRGIKVIMEKLPSICMTDTAHSYYECGIKWDQRLTYSGEYLHSAPWNHSLGQANLSNGCTNLSPSVAESVYNLMRVGDVVSYPNADGPQMTLGAGYGDWNMDWGSWQTGGAVPTT